MKRVCRRCGHTKLEHSHYRGSGWRIATECVRCLDCPGWRPRRWWLIP